MGDAGRYNDYYRPPLAKDLFANRPLFTGALDKFPQCKTVVPRLRAPEVLRAATSIESLLQEIEEEAKTYPAGLQELAAVRCYLQRAINECEQKWWSTTRRVTNYLTLLREIKRLHQGEEPILLVTFNYDTLLEDALVDLGREFKSLESYTRSTDLFRVFKLHGSVHWAQEVETQLPPNMNLHPGAASSVLRYLVEHAAELQISDRFVFCNPSEMGVANGRPVFPAIAIPVEKKFVFQCPRYMIDDLEAALPQVTAIFMIGWRATEDHFLDLLRQHLRSAVYVCIVAGEQSEAAKATGEPPESVKILRRIQLVLPGYTPNISPEPTGFTEFIRTRRAHQLFAHFLRKEQEQEG